MYSTFKPQQYGTMGYSRKIFETKKIFFLIFYPSPSLATKPTDQSCSNSISRVPLEISLARFFRFLSTLKFKGNSHKKKFKILIF